MKWFILLFLSGLLLSGCQAATTVDSCDVLAESYVAGVDALLGKWDAANAAAGNTSRDDLPQAISRLQTIRAEADELAPPSCAEHVQQQLVQSMDSTISVYRAFMAHSPNDQVSDLATQAQAARASFVESFNALKADEL